jgi:hypothetical protein
MTGRIDKAGYSRTAQWVTWIPHRGAATADEAAAEATTTPEARTAVAAWIRSTDLRVGQIKGVFRAAGWVPEPTGGVVALLVATIVRGEPGLDAAAYKAKSEKAKIPRGVKMFDRAVLGFDLPSGRAVVEVEISASRRQPRVDHSVIWTVFPEGVVDAVRMHFRTSHSDLLDALADDARVMAETVVVTTVEAE